MNEFKNFISQMSKIKDTVRSEYPKVIARLDRKTPTKGNISRINAGAVLEPRENKMESRNNTDQEIEL